MTYLWIVIISCGATNRVDIPFLPKVLAVTIDGPKKESLKEPKVVVVVDVETMTPFTANKKSPPSVYKLGPEFNPHMLNPSVVGRPVVWISKG